MHNTMADVRQMGSLRKICVNSQIFATQGHYFFQTTNFPVEESEKHIVLKSKSKFARIKKEQKIYFASAKTIAQNTYNFEILISTVKYFVSTIQKTSINDPSLLKSLKIVPCFFP